MKVLFAISNEEISESIVKKYQKDYKQIISYKNVYYFNAILKELQKDKSYERVVISEDLESFTHNQYDQIDKFIFEKLDNISDESADLRGNDIPIILICSDRRNKSEEMLVKLFGIGIYNAIIGKDRSVDEICKLINRPRSKKEAKTYYRIESESVNYQSEKENDVSEIEIQNILAHYKRLGKNEDRFIDSFNNIAAQYNDTQLRIISKFLPLNVRAVLEEKSPKYQQIMSFNNAVSDSIRRPKNEEKIGPSEKLLTSRDNKKIMSKPVVIPSEININSNVKLSREKKRQTSNAIEQELQQKMTKPQQNNDFELNSEFVQTKNTSEEFNLPNAISQNIEEEQYEEKQTVKRGRGRPRKTPVQIETNQVNDGTKRGRGRPRKTSVQTNEEMLPGLASNIDFPKDDEEEILPGVSSNSNYQEGEEVTLPGLSSNNNYQEDEEITLPGLSSNNNYQEDEEVTLSGISSNNNYQEDEEVTLPGLSSNNNYQEGEEVTSPGLSSNINYQDNETEKSQTWTTNLKDSAEEILPGLSGNSSNKYNDETLYETNKSKYSNNSSAISYKHPEINTKSSGNSTPYQIEEIDLSSLLTPGKKIVSFVGTSKNGTSFIVNNLAELISSMGVNTAILDATQNRNAYYIYTKNEEDLRKIATHSIDGLANGVANGISVNKNLTIYTSLPNEGKAIVDADKVLESLLKQHSLILIDSDFETPVNYFKQSQEIYLVQSLDILTIQPLTAFLRELKAQNILEEKKLRVILNKAVKIRGINEKTIIGGMAYYNDPAMSYMTELFDRNIVRYISIPFEEETYIKYLENIIECEISLKGYSKVFMQVFKELANMVYPINNTYRPPSTLNNINNSTFSPNINNTLNQMKKNY